MHRRLLLRPALAALASALLAFAFDAATTTTTAALQETDSITQGSLRALDAEGKPAAECPLKRTEVRAEVSGFISRVTVTQEFENPFPDKIEAVYVFPLSQSAAVDDMTMLVGGRAIKARIMRREQAQAAYKEARAAGHIASLLDQERPNIFTQSVANILPGQSVKVVISYVETLRYEAGTYEWSFPMVVGQRYIPAGAPGGEADARQQEPEGGRPQEEDARRLTETDAAQSESPRVPDAARINPASPPGGTRAGHDITIEVALDAGVPLEGVVSNTHEIEVERPESRRAVVRLKGGAVIPNKDFVLKYDVAGGRVEDAVLTHASARGRFFALILQPPERVAPAEVTPKELVFVLDTSGSMNGFPLEKAKETMALALEGLNPQDAFNLITFSGDTHVLFDAPVPATAENLARAKKFLADRSGGGGTEMMKAIRAALSGSESSGRVRVVCFMTDGQVGNDHEILSEVQRRPHARVFAMGFGSAPNRYLLDKMAEYGRGEVEYVTDRDPGSAAARRFHERVRDPLLTDLSVEWEGLAVADVYPKAVPDLFGAKPVVLVGRYAGGSAGRIRLRGKSAGGDFAREIAVTLPDAEPAHDVLASLWARARIGELMRRDSAAMQMGQVAEPLREEITRLGLDFRLMTQFTSFVAVEERVVTDGGEPRRVDVPAAAPAGRDDNAVEINGTVYAGGGVQETVTVMAASSQVSALACGIVFVVENRVGDGLPLKGRDTRPLAALAPGVVAGPGAREPGGFSVNGQRPRSNGFEVDGLSADVGITPGGRSPGATASGAGPALTAAGAAHSLATVEAVQEHTVRTDYYEPQYGRVSGAQVSISTRSGTNEFRGSLFGSFGDDALDANDWFANSRGALKQPRRLAAFGGALGGPVKRDQTFFFFSYEGQRARQPAFSFTEVPTLAARLAAPSAVRAFLEAFPAPNGAARGDGFAEFASGFSSPARHDAFGLRLDHRVSDTLMLNARYAAADSSAEGRGAFGSSLNTLSRVRALAQTLTGSASYVISPEMILDARAGYGRVAVRGSRALDAFGGAVVPGGDTPAGALLTNPGGGFVFNLGGLGAALATGDEAENLQRQLNVVGALARVWGNHTFKFGGDYRRLAPVVGLHPRRREVFFDGVAGALSGVAARDGAFAFVSDSRPVFQHLSAYAQDEWRATPRLTLTYGLRWELSPAPQANGGGAHPPAVTQVDDASRLAFGGAGEPLWRTRLFNFAPRFGVAWQASEESGRETLVRAGFGLFYDAGVPEAGYAFADASPFVTGGAAFGVPFAFEGPPPSGSPLGVPVSAFDPRLKLPYTLRWSAEVTRSLGSEQTLSAAYVGAAGRRMFATRTLIDPSPDFSLVRLTTNGAESDYHSARLQFTRRLSDGLQATAVYTFAKSLDGYTEDEPARALLRGEGVRAERGPSDFDARHTLAGFVSYKLPAAFERGAAEALTRNWTFDAIFGARSALPVNVVYGFPTAYGFAYLRPDFVGGAPLYISDPTAPGGRRLNPSAFVLPGAARQGTLGRNALRGFPFQQFDVSLRRQFYFNERVNLQVRAEAFNLLNHPSFDSPLATLGLAGSRGDLSAVRLDPYFGRSVTARGAWRGQDNGFGPLYAPGGPRTVQLSLKLSF